MSVLTVVFLLAFLAIFDLIQAVIASDKVETTADFKQMSLNDRLEYEVKLIDSFLPRKKNLSNRLITPSRALLPSIMLKWLQTSSHRIQSF